jgi:phospholipid/cholesterol/gamma-HCH transport system substrate-binding protein
MTRSSARPIVLLVALAAVALAVGAYLLAHQRLYPPAWVPIVGSDDFVMYAELTSASGVLPGQGQAVTVSGVTVGQIASVDLRDGRAVLRLRIEPRFANVHPDATLLLRPKTGLKDMVVELDPGTPQAGPRLRDGATLTTAATDPDVNFDEILAMLDADTRGYLALLLTGGGEALGDGGGRELAATFRRFEPLSRHVAEATRLVARRRHRLARLMGNLSELAEELGARDRQLATFVRANTAVFRRFSRQNEQLAATIEELPGTLDSVDRGLGRADDLARTLETSLTDLEPAARSLAPSLRQVQPFLTTTTPVLRDQLRPFAREALPTARRLGPATGELAAATPDLTTLTDVLNALFDTLAYDPPGNGVDGQGFLFYVPWANHNTNSVLSTQDGVGAMRRGLVLINCPSLQLLESLAAPRRNPTLSTLIQLLNAPVRAERCGRGAGG